MIEIEFAALRFRFAQMTLSDFLQRWPFGLVEVVAEDDFAYVME